MLGGARKHFLTNLTFRLNNQKYYLYFFVLSKHHKIATENFVIYSNNFVNVKNFNPSETFKRFNHYLQKITTVNKFSSITLHFFKYFYLTMRQVYRKVWESMLFNKSSKLHILKLHN